MGRFGNAVTGAILWGIGGAFGLTAIILGVNGSTVLRRAISDYNHRNHADLTLSIAPTPGGLGLQLRF